MSPGLLLLILRIVMGVVLLGFLVLALFTLRRDLLQETPRHVILPATSLVLDSGGEVDKAIALDNINLIGRAADNTVKLQDEVVSAHHARLSYLSGRQWWLEDLGSRNGTRVNGILVQEPVVVTDQDQISFGTVECRLVVERAHTGLPSNES